MNWNWESILSLVALVVLYGLASYLLGIDTANLGDGCALHRC